MPCRGVMKAKDIIEQRMRAYQAIFTSPNGQTVLDDLRSQFGGTTLRKSDGVIDVNASIAAAGCREVVLYIEQMMRISENAVD